MQLSGFTSKFAKNISKMFPGFILCINKYPVQLLDNLYGWYLFLASGKQIKVFFLIFVISAPEIYLLYKQICFTISR